MTNFLRPAAFALGVIVAVLSTPASAQTDEERSGARAAGLAGLEAYNAGKYQQAADYFARAESLMHAPTHLLYLARANVKLGHFVSAREYYIKLTQDRLPASASKPFRDAQNNGDKELSELEPRVPYVSVVVQATGARDVQVTRDNEPIPPALLGVPHPEDPGTHTFHATGEGTESAPSTVTLKEGSHETVLLTVPPSPKKAVVPVAAAEPSSSSSGTSGARFGSEGVNDTASRSNGTSAVRVLSYVGIGLGAVGLGVGSYFLVQSQSTRSRSNAIGDKCLAAMSCFSPPGSDNDAATVRHLEDDANTQRTVGFVGMIAGGAFLVTGVTMLIVDVSGQHHESAATTVHPMLGLNYAGLSGSF